MGHSFHMDEHASPVAITIRPATLEDANSIADTFIESAEYHAGLDPQRYSPPAVETISARYREGRQHPPGAGGETITLVAEFSGEIIGFIDARLDQSPDPMHREMIYCHIAEIAVRSQHRNQGIGSLSLRAAEDWGRREGAEFASLEISRRKHACQRVLSTADGLLRSIRHRNKAPLVFNRGRRNPSLRLERSRHLTRRAR